MSVTWVTRDEALGVVKGKVARTEVVLDVGPGIRPQSYFRPHVHICVEPYLPYISRLRKQVGNDPVYVFLNCTWQHPETAAGQVGGLRIRAGRDRTRRET